MSSTAQSSLTPDPPEPEEPTGHTQSDARPPRLCKAARVICVLAAIGLSIAAIFCFIMSIMRIMDSVPTSPPSDVPTPESVFLSEGQVGDSRCDSYVSFGENYSWPMPQLRLNHHSYSTITEMDEAKRSRTWDKKSETTFKVEAWVRPGIAEQRTDNLPMASASASDETLPELLYPGRSHEPCAANTGTISRPLIALDAIFKLSWYALCLFVVVQMYRLFTHCLGGSILDGDALGICRKILVCYTAMLIYGPLSLYVFNLISSSGVVHIISIPYAGIVLLLVLSSLYALMRKAGELKTEVDATV